MDGNYRLFYTISENGGERGEGSPPYNPDNDSYTIWYKKASSIAGLETATATQLPNSDPPAGLDQRDVAAYQWNNFLVVYASSGQSGSDKNLRRYYTSNGTTWLGPFLTGYGSPITPYQVGHHDMVLASGNIYLVFEDNSGKVQVAEYN